MPSYLVGPTSSVPPCFVDVVRDRLRSLLQHMSRPVSAMWFGTASGHCLVHTAHLEGHHDLADPVEEREEPDPHEDQRGPRREVLLRRPETPQELRYLREQDR